MYLCRKVCANLQTPGYNLKDSASLIVRVLCYITFEMILVLNIVMLQIVHGKYINLGRKQSCFKPHNTD